VFGGIGAVVVGGAVVAALQFGMIGGGAVSPPAGAVPPAADTGGGRTAGTTGGTGDTGKAPGASPQASRPVANNPPPGGTPTNGKTTTVPQVNHGPRIAALVGEVMGAEEDAQVRIGRNAIAEVLPLLGDLRGTQLDSARYVLLLAYGATDNVAKTCEFKDLILGSRLAESEKSVARGLTATLNCPE
jgi:hypothetical protein